MSRPAPRRATVTAVAAVVLGLLAQPLASGTASAAPVAGVDRLTRPSAPRAGDPGVLSPTDQVVHDNLLARALNARLGRDLAGAVVDAQTGAVLWEQTPLELQIPASNAKLVTAVNALTAYGPTGRLTTSVVQAAPDRVVLVGGGDPSLTRAMLRALAASTAAAVRASGLTRVRVSVDDSRFPAPSLAVGWSRFYVPRDVSAVRALVVDQHRSVDTSLDAGRLFTRLLERRGLSVGRRVVHRRAPLGAPVLGTVQGAPMATMVATMLRDSDNDYAEVLHRMVAVKAGFAPTWEGAQAAQRQVLLGQGVDLGPALLYDGSGLSRADRIAAADLVHVLALVFDGRHPLLASMQHNSLAIAGLTGTLGPRFLRYTTRPTRCAAGLIEAKTGSLSGVISLSGFARGADGQVKLFSFVLNSVPSTLATRRAVDRLASTITGCW
jgi:serine-type D-Ala-D-Ala carboxypeptidase/endopeptidase (penicillin-binding protein 4)